MALREAWLSAQEGRLCAWQRARALAFARGQRGDPRRSIAEAFVNSGTMWLRPGDDAAWHMPKLLIPGGFRGNLGSNAHAVDTWR